MFSREICKVFKSAFKNAFFKEYLQWLLLQRIDLHWSKYIRGCWMTLLPCHGGIVTNVSDHTWLECATILIVLDLISWLSVRFGKNLYLSSKSLIDINMFREILVFLKILYIKKRKEYFSLVLPAFTLNFRKEIFKQVINVDHSRLFLLAESVYDKCEYKRKQQKQPPEVLY